jgi:hypothetical protein
VGWIFERREELNVLSGELPGAKQPAIGNTACCVDGGVSRYGIWLKLFEEGGEDGEGDWLDRFPVLLPMVYLDSPNKMCDDWGFTCGEGDVAVNVE